VTEYLTTQQLADKLGIPAETCRYWRHVGKGPKSLKFGRHVRYAVQDVEEFIAAARGASA